MSSPLSHVLSVMEQIAPLELAADWDNVGLLIEPTPVEHAAVTTALLTIDLTEPVLAEAIAVHAELIIAYHPPIFSALRRLTQATPGERLVVRAVGSGTAVYSPHTALDACQGGLNDWLAAAFGEGKSIPIEPHVASEVQGQGRLLALNSPLELDEAVLRVKGQLGLQHVRVARPHGKKNPLLRTVAVCAGAGGSLLSKVQADLYLTGEMRHHDILAKQARESSVIVCDHTNTERGYLPVLAAKLDERLKRQVQLIVSRVDSDPLVVV